MASILAKLRTYNGKWNVASKEAFDAADIASIQSNEVVPSEYGMSVEKVVTIVESVELNRVGGQTSFIPVSNTSREVHAGESVDLSKCFIITLSRSGDNDIYRIEIQ